MESADAFSEPVGNGSRAQAAPSYEAVATAPFPILIFAQDGVVVLVGKSLSESTGYTIRDLPTVAEWMKRVLCVKQGSLQAHLDQACGPHPIEHLGECTIRTRGGEIRTWEYRAGPLGKRGDGMPLGILAASDITQRKRLEEALTERTRLAAFAAEIAAILVRNDSLHSCLQKCTEAVIRSLDATSARIWIFNKDEDLLVLEASAGAKLPDAERQARIPTGKGKLGMIAEYRRPHFCNSVLDDPQLIDSDWAKREGVVSFVGYPLIVEDCLVGVLAMYARRPLADVPLHCLAAVCGGIAQYMQRKSAEERVRLLSQEMKERVHALEAANKELEAFSYSVSHDLRAPLRAIDEFSSILFEEHGKQLSSAGLRCLDRVRQNSLEMRQLIEDLLAFSKLSRQPLRKQEVSPADLVGQVLEELASDRAGRNVRITVGELPVCLADPVLLKLVYTNLLSNALKYTRSREAARIDIGAEAQRNCLGGIVYFVKDNGVGFQPQYLPKLFGVFQRLHAAEEYEGTGVGLAIVKRILERHGGVVWAEARPDEGAKFYFSL